MLGKLFYMFLSAIIVCWPLPLSAGEKVIKIGVSATYSGGFAAVGKNVSDGEIDLLRWIGAHGGIKYKDPKTGKMESVGIHVIVEDNKYKAALAVMAYKKFTAEGAIAITGFGSTPGESCSKMASDDKIPYLSWYSYASPSGLAPQPQYYWTFLPTIVESATPMIKWFVTEKWKGQAKPKIAIMAANVPSWQVIGKPGLMEKYIRSLGAELVGIEFIPLAATDLSDPIIKLVHEKGADCLVLIGATFQTVTFAKDLRRVDVDPDKTTVICNVSAWDESLFQSIPKEMEGLYGEVHAVSVEADAPGVERVKEVAKWAGKDPEKIVINYINGFMGSLVLEAAIKRALEKHGYDKVMESGEAIRNELHFFKALDPMGLAPPIEVKYQDEPYFLNYARIVRAKAGKFVEASNWVEIDRITGALLPAGQKIE